MTNERTIYFFDTDGAVMESITYYVADLFAACRAAADHADEIGAADYDFELPETDAEEPALLEAAE